MAFEYFQPLHIDSRKVLLFLGVFGMALTVAF